MSSSPRQLRICPQCGKKFGKEPKLERHLLEVHGATLSIPPPTTPPSPSFLLVETQLESALAEANRCFQLGNPSCRLCVHKKPFKNSRDLAQHLVSKHERQLMCAETVPLPCPPTSSEVSAKPPVRAQLRSNAPHKRAHIEHSLPAHQPQLKKPKRTAAAEYKQPASSILPAVACVTPSVNAHQLTDAAFNDGIAAQTDVPSIEVAPAKSDLRHNTTPNFAHSRVRIDDSLPASDQYQVNEANRTRTSAADGAKRAAANSLNKCAKEDAPSAMQRSKSAPLVNHSTALSSNSSSRSGTPSSGSKPPVTPKRSKAVLAPKDSMKKASSPGATTGANGFAAESKSTPIFNPLRGIVHKHTTTMDFSSVGLGSNTRKSYYTLKNS